MICLYIGRFQPIHIGHLDVIHQIFDHGYEKILIGVGSSNITNEKNPRTFPQRKEMITQALLDRGVDQERIDIIGIPDFSEDEDWLSYIRSSFEFEAVMSGNTWVAELFRAHSILVLDELERIPIHGTDIRKLRSNDDWDEIKKRVTSGVYQYLLAL